jgi:hypothetical protein
LKDENEKKIKKQLKKNMSQLRLTCKPYDHGNCEILELG